MLPKTYSYDPQAQVSEYTPTRPWFMYRLCMPRPHVVSIILLLWSLHCLLNHRRIALGVIIFVYTLSYAAFHP